MQKLPVRTSLIKAFLPSITAIAVFIACAKTPETNRRQLMLIDQGQMSQLGEKAYHQIREQTPTMPRNQRTEFIEDIMKQLTQVVDKDFDWEITVFDSPERNAFCLPGGKMGIYSGMLEITDTNEATAAVLGHEIAHATTRHGAESLSQGLVAQGLMTLTHLSLEDSKYRGLIMGALGVGVQVGVMLPYSRKQETEANHIGTIYMALAGYDPQAAVEVWQKMQQAGGSIPPGISKHSPPPCFTHQKADERHGPV
jgi:predicted Zn-dependent protease